MEDIANQYLKFCQAIQAVAGEVFAIRMEAADIGLNVVKPSVFESYTERMIQTAAVLQSLVSQFGDRPQVLQEIAETTSQTAMQLFTRSIAIITHAEAHGMTIPPETQSAVALLKHAPGYTAEMEQTAQEFIRISLFSTATSPSLVQTAKITRPSHLPSAS